MWAVPQAFCAVIVLWITTTAASDTELEFILEPISRLVKISETRAAVFRCVASPSSAEIRWLYRGQPVTQSQRWIRVSDHKLTVLLGRMDRNSKSQHNLSNAYFQCEIRLKGQVLVSAPAKLTVAVLDQFPDNQPDAHLHAILGNTAVIPCDPPHSEPIVITEFNFNNAFISASTDRKRIMPSGDLQILNVTYEDAGEYRCIANNPFLMKNVTSPRKVILRVEEPVDSSIRIPPFFVKSPRSRLAVALGTNVTLECVAGGYPVPKVTWNKHHGPLPHGRYHQHDGNLVIINIKKGDEGVYHCNAENSAGPKMSGSIHVEVQESPQIIRPPKSLSVEVGDNITLNCLTHGHPKPSIKWLHNGRTITGLHTKRSPLVIMNASWKHSGIYQCFASNKLGTVYAAIVVTVTKGNNSILSDYDDDNYEATEEIISLPKPHHGKEKEINHDISDPVKDENGHDHPPKKHHKKKHSKGVKLVPPSKPYVTRLSNSSVMVRWTVPRNDGLPVIFFKVQYKEVGKGHTDWETVEEDIAAHIHSYAVTDLKPGAAYRFQVAAVYSNNDNKSGPMSAKFVLLKSSPVEKPSPAPVITFAEAASPSAITLHWENEIQNSVPIVGYFIHYRATHTAGKYLKVTVLGANTRSHIISHLLPDTGYDMKMQSFNDAGTSDFSNIYTSKTKPAEIVPGIHSRKKAHQSDGADISHTETVSSKNSESNFKLYIIIGSVFGILLLIVLLCTLVFFRQKHNMDTTCDESDRESDDPMKVRNGYVTNNGYLAVNKIGLNVNPLSHLDIEDDDKPDELENIVSNNNEIIRLQTFNVDADHTVDPLLSGSQVNESEFNGDEEAEAVIVSCGSGVSTELKQEN